MHREFALTRALGRGTIAAIVGALLAVATAAAETYPTAAGNGFSGSQEGWTGLAASCNQEPLCSAANVYAPTQGNPPGSIESRTDIFVNGGQLFAGTTSWRSPSFLATTTGGGTLEYDRQLSAPGLATVEPAVTVEEVLVDETAATSKSLGVEQVLLADGVFRGRSLPVRGNALTLGHRYHLELRSRMTTNSAQVGPTGSIAIRFDNVGLALADRGPGGASGSDGVSFTSPPLSDRQVEKLTEHTNWAADRGNFPGGSVIARRHCTIVGTPKADRIKGSRGNDVICGLGGNDKIVGRGGKDLIDAGSGKDVVSGDAGKDTIAGLAGRDRIKGGPGPDKLGSGGDGDRDFGSGGNDLVKAGSGADLLAGNAGRDRLSGGPGRDRLAGPPAKDRLRSVERR